MKKLIFFLSLLTLACNDTDNDENISPIEPLIGYWDFYSSLGVNFSGLSVDEIVYFDNNNYCSDLFMEFKSDGSYKDYYDFISAGNPGCDGPENATRGNWENNGGFYRLSTSNYYDDYYIDFSDDYNSITFDFDGVIYVYKRRI